jgi:hypothetical protein
MFIAVLSISFPSLSPLMGDSQYISLLAELRQLLNLEAINISPVRGFDKPISVRLLLSCITMLLQRRRREIAVPYPV